MKKYYSLIEKGLRTKSCKNTTNRLEKYHYIPGIFENLVSGFSIEDFLSTAPLEKIFKYENSLDIGVFFQEHENEQLSSKEFFMKSLDIPLPAWAKELQYHLLSRLYAEGSCGYSLDLFVSSGKNKSLGTHIDNDDVYTVQLYGAKHWILDSPDLHRLKRLIDAQLVKRLSPSETWVSNTNTSLEFGESISIIMKPGDFLATPAFALHKVTTLTDGYNLSFNVGIRHEHYWQQFLNQSEKLS